MKPAVLVLCLLISTHAAAGVTYACVCASWIPCGFSADAEAVFVGEVLESTELTRKVMRAAVESEEQRQVSRLKVEQAFFGTEGNTEIVIETLVGNNSCKFPLGNSTKYLIYAHRERG